MDEFIVFHPLACHLYPFAGLHSFVEPCDGVYDLKLGDYWLPLRSYIYTGSSPALLYLPFRMIWPSVNSFLLYGILLFMAFVWGAKKTLNLSLPVTLSAVVFFFPLAYQMIHDTGPVALQVIAMALAPFLLRQALESQKIRRKALFYLPSGILLFFAIESKPLFLSILPAFVIANLALINSELDLRSLWHKLRAQIFMMLIAAVPLGVIYSASNRAGRTYFSNLQDHSTLGGFATWMDFKAELIKTFSQYVLNFNHFAHRVFGYENKLDPATLAYLAGFALTGVLAFILKIPRKEKIRILSLLFSGALIFLLIRLQTSSWAGHHFILAWVYPVLALAFSLQRISEHKKALAFGLASVFMLTQSWTSYSLFRREPLGESSSERAEIFKQVQTPELSSKSIYVHLDWGTYYQSSLYGPKDQVVTYVYIDQVHAFHRLASMARDMNRKLMFICHPHTCVLLQQHLAILKNLEPVNLDLELRHWAVWISNPVLTQSH